MARQILSIVVVGSSPSISIGQPTDVSDLLSRIPVVNIEDLFLGFGVDIVRTEIQDRKKMVDLKVRFDQLKRGVWRCQTSDTADNGSGEFVLIQDGGFSFDASRTNNGQFQFGRLGFGSEMRNELIKNRYSKMSLLVGPADVMGTTLREFISIADFSITSKLNLDNYKGHRVEGIRFEFPLKDKKFTGELQWLPDNDYLLFKVYVQSLQNDGSVRVSANTLIDYESVGSQFLPFRVTRDFKNGNMSITEATAFGTANPDRSYYTAESLRLETPGRSIPTWTLWLILAALCLALGFYCRSRTQRK